MEEQDRTQRELKSLSPDATIKILTVAPEDANKSHTKLIDKLKVLVDLVRALAWPVLIASIIIAYRAPIGKVVTKLAERVGQASKLSYGKLSLEIAQQAREIGSPELAEKIGGLSPLAIQTLLQVSHQPYALMGHSEREGNLLEIYSLPKEAEIAALQELDSKGLIKFKENLNDFLTFFRGLNMKPGTPNAADDPFDNFNPPKALTRDESQRLLNEDYQITEQGKKATEAIMKAIENLLKEKPSNPSDS